MNEEEVREETGQETENKAAEANRQEPESVETPPGSSAEGAEPEAAGSEAEALRRELAASREEAEQLRRERFLLLKGIPEEDLDYYVFKIGKLVTDETDFAAAAGQFLKQREKKTAAGLFRSAARLTGGAPRTATANETMNRLIRGL